MSDQQLPSEPPTLAERLAAKCERIAQQVRVRRREGLYVVPEHSPDWRDR